VSAPQPGWQLATSFYLIENREILIGFAPRKANLSLYISVGIQEHAAAIEKLGKHKTGVGCLYINR